MKHCIFDTETTSLIHNSLQPLHKQPKIIEFFAMILDDEKEFAEVGTVHSYIDPGQPISAEVTKITGITQDQLKGKPKFVELADEIGAALGRSDVVVAHNISYDMAVVDFEFKRLERTFAWPDRRVCTVEASESIKGHRLSLTALHTELFGEAFDKAHSAENDVRATARCYIELIRRGEI